MNLRLIQALRNPASLAGFAALAALTLTALASAQEGRPAPPARPQPQEPARGQEQRPAREAPPPARRGNAREAQPGEGRRAGAQEPAARGRGEPPGRREPQGLGPREQHDVALQMISAEAKHRDIQGRIARLEALFREKGDTESLAKLAEVKAKAEKRFRAAFAGYKDQLGPQGFSRVEAAIAKRNAGGAAPAQREPQRGGGM